MVVNEVLKVCALQKEPHYRYQGAKPASVALDREPGARRMAEKETTGIGLRYRYCTTNLVPAPVLYCTISKTEKYCNQATH